MPDDSSITNYLSTSLCSACTAMLDAVCSKPDPDGEIEDEVPGHVFFIEWKISAQTGCPLCIAVCAMAREFADYLEQHPRRWMFLERDDNWCSFDSLHLKFRIETGFNRYHREDLFVQRNLSARYVKPVYHPVDKSTGSEQSLKLAHKWIGECLDNHEHSQPTINSDTQLPTRLLELDEQGCHLCLATELRSKAPYVTLSHCWGTEPEKIFKLLKTNFDMLRVSIPMELLCKTFREAIDTTRFLGYKYLWIDSLCIIQDSDIDWQKEASLMSYVYGNAILNIAATWAVDGSKGLYTQRDPRFVNRKWFKYDHAPNLRYSSRNHSEDEGENLWKVDESSHATRLISRSPLNQRSWVLQERFLAQRTLHFSEEQLFFECQDHDHTLTAEVPFRSTYSDESISREASTQNWVNIIAAYSRTTATRPEDRLVALSGIARSFQQKTGERYYAGLWSGNFLQQLMWHLEDEDEDEWEHVVIRTNTTPFRYRAPSWSWASTDQPATWDYYIDLFSPESDYLPLVHDIDVDCTLIGQNPFGQISAAQIRLVCGALFRKNLMKVEKEDISLRNAYHLDNVEDADEEDFKNVYLLLLFMQLKISINGRLYCSRYQHNIRKPTNDSMNSAASSSQIQSIKEDGPVLREDSSHPRRARTSIISKENLCTDVSSGSGGEDSSERGEDPVRLESESGRSINIDSGISKPSATGIIDWFEKDRLKTRHWYETYGLIVEPSLSHGKGHFIRVGVFSRHFQDAEYQEFQDSFTENPDALMDESLYESCCGMDENGRNQYRIVLV